MEFKLTRQKIRDAIRTFREGKGLKARAARGSSWLAVGSGAEEGLRLIRNMILTRLLAPEVFGVMALIFAVNTFFQSFTEVGVREAIIQNPEGDEDTYLNGVWWLSLGRSAILYCIAYFGSPLIARFYNNLELVQMFRVAFLTLVFRGIFSPRAYVLVKKLEFKKWIWIEQFGGVLGILTTIILAYFTYNAWALVIGFTVESIARALLSYIVCPYVPRLKFDGKHIRSLFKFARGMVGLPILTFVYMRLDVFFIGKLRTTEELGLYNMAANLARIPSLFMAKFISPLFMPALSEMQDDNDRINKAILKINRVFAFIGVPLIIFVAMYAKPFLSIIYTPQYAQVSVPFSILFAAAMIQNFSRPTVAAFLAKGLPGLLRAITGLRALLVAVLMYPAIHFFGLEGASAVVLIAMLTMNTILILRMSKLTGLKKMQYSFAYFGALVFSAPIIVIRVLLLYYLTLTPIMYVLIGVVSLSASYFLLKRFNAFLKRIQRVHG